MTDRDTFAAAALTGLLANGDYSVESTPLLAYRMADAMLAFRDSQIAKKTNHEAAPAAKATADRYVRRAAADGDAESRHSEGTGDTPRPHPTPPQGPVAWAVAGDNGNYAVKLCFDELGAQREVYRRTSVGLKQDYVVVPLYCHPKLTITDAELNAIQHVVEDGRFVDLGDYGRIRSLLVRLRPEWEDESDRSKPISDERLAALEELSAFDQELEAKHGLQGNPMIKARRNNESI